MGRKGSEEEIMIDEGRRGGGEIRAREERWKRERSDRRAREERGTEEENRER